MDNSVEVLEYTLKSLNECTNQTLHKIVNIFIEDGIATKRNEENSGKIYIGSMTSKSGLFLCLKEQNSAIKSIEKWEFDKNYKYSMLFDVKNFDEKIIGNLLDSNQMVCYDNLDRCEELYSVAMNPSIKKIDSNYCLKFNFKLSATDTYGEKLKKRYTVVAIYYSDKQMLELRFDTVEQIYSRERFYFVYGVLEWLRRYLGLSITAIDLKEIADYIMKNGKTDQVVPSAQDMHMASGGKATVEVGNNDKMILPFIGELKILMESYDDDFRKAPILKKVFEDFIYEKENLSEFPWIRFKFEEKNFEVKFLFDYGRENGCLLQHFHSALKANQGRERMDYVTNYIIKVRDIVKTLPTEQ
ncbi:hypothetical protein [Enterocloster citroniae]|uniref:hypothetical protein n=1 Tax=Enterocloster citroniae TaxID=358743 RepID=UPI00349EA1D0